MAATGARVAGAAYARHLLLPRAPRGFLLGGGTRHASSVVPPSFYKLALKRSPFSIFSKEAPRTLPQYDVDKDFCYYFFADWMHMGSGLLPSDLTAGGRNAKSDFPVDYESYFKDDAEVTQNFPFPMVKDIVEPWGPPGMQTVVHTKKTGVDFSGSRYMLGCFVPFDDVELGVTRFRTRLLPPELPELTHVPESWYGQAFKHLPYRAAVVSAEGEVLDRNNLMGDLGGVPTAIQVCLKQAKEAMAVDGQKECWEFGRVAAPGGAGTSYRAWLWCPTKDKSMYAVAFKEHAATTAATQPELVRSALG